MLLLKGPGKEASGEENEAKGAGLSAEFLTGVGMEIEEGLYQQFLPVFSFVQQQEKGGMWLLGSQMNSLMPFYGYAAKKEGLQGDESVSSEGIFKSEEAFGETKEEAGEDKLLSLEEILRAESRECITYTGEEQSLQELLQAENQGPQEVLPSGEQEGGLLPQKESALQRDRFMPHGLQAPIALETVMDYETLIRDFYTVDGNTMAGSDQLNAKALLEKDMRLQMQGEGPQILIYHTHSQEAFADSLPGDESTSILGVGARLEQILTQQYGYRVLHHKGKYDVNARDDAYANSLPAIEQLLAENPSIEIVIDLHRDQMAEETRLVMDLDGRPTARFMFFNGLSRTRRTGNISYLYNEYQEENLAFSFQMKIAAMQYYPGLTRKNYLKGYRYNMHLRPRTLLIELGAQNNTVQEAMNACDPLAHILHLVLSGEAVGLS